MNGTTVHGSQSTDPAKRRTPQTYYGEDGPVGDIFAVATRDPTGRPNEVGVVGLGAGALAAYVDDRHVDDLLRDRPGRRSQVATDPRYFTYLSDAPTTPRDRPGRRAAVAARPNRTARYDLLILDAFSSDSIPVHLLTVEAIADEVRTLEPDGLIAFHISNRYYDLAPADRRRARPQRADDRSSDAHAAGAVSEPGETPSRWLAASRDPERDRRAARPGWTDVQPADRPFTDDYADLLTYLHARVLTAVAVATNSAIRC